ncbi:hypothetical protein M9980_07535 [Sphingomonas donggukensis]|uniref:CBM-cenC domain-containing protein n=1 Tax=Sphingomonas donggukensis TaxID=2949093 RepID=A0ABY4TR69_9SPHN|nr:hypothetical protein [Sphingomonas donggukensis]URW74439.1 hypothetical protein M9980_07535 [Sphingomonas donggukensis]
MTNVTLPTGARGARVAALAVAAVIGVCGLRSALSFAALKANPELAYTVDSGNAEAVAGLAYQRMLEAKGPDDAVATRKLATEALEISPYAPQALRNIGFVVARMEGEPKAEPILVAAGRTSLRDFLTHLWLFDKYYRDDQTAKSIGEADIVLSQQPDRWDGVFPMLIGLLDDPATKAPLAEVLVRRPYWRPTFLERLGLDKTNAAGKYDLLAELKRRGQPASSAELRTYFLVSPESTPAPVLRARWVSLLTNPSLAQTLLLDGSFDGVDAPPPYVWTFTPSGDTYAERQQREDGRGSALYASFNGQGNATFAVQSLALRSGRYRLSGQALAEDATVAGQFSWIVQCGIAGGREIGRLALAPGSGWTRYSGVVDVPADCAGQTLALTATGVENGHTATLWVDDVSIARAPGS